MAEVSIIFVGSVFLAGILMFFAPCTLPLVPAYLAFIGGVSNEELQNPNTRAQAKHTILLNGVMFVLGFTVVFVSFGLLLGIFGGQFGQFRNILAQAGGALIVFFGLMVLNLIRIEPLLKQRKFHIPSFLTPGRPASAFGIGATFALGWSPCVGPVLASVLLLAANSATAFSGALLLLVFSLGLAIPFLLTAAMYSQASYIIVRMSTVAKWINYMGGAFLIFLGILLLTNNFGFLLDWGYKFFNLLGIEGIYDYL